MSAIMLTMSASRSCKSREISFLNSGFEMSCRFSHWPLNVLFYDLNHSKEQTTRYDQGAQVRVGVGDEREALAVADLSEREQIPLLAFGAGHDIIGGI